MLFGRELVQNEIVLPHQGRFLSDMETYRRRLDYGSGGVERKTDDLIQQTSEFLDGMREITQSGLTDD